MKPRPIAATLAWLAFAFAAPGASESTVKLITSFESGNPFYDATVVEEHASDGRKALRVARYAILEGPQNWTGYDYLKVDVFAESSQPQPLYIEIRDSGTEGYWTRVNYHTVAPPGSSTLALPLNQLYVGEKSRPGRPLRLGEITRLVFNAGEQPVAPLYLDNLRLERDNSAREAQFDGLRAFDFGATNSPVMEGFTAITPATLYTKERGYGLNNAHIWRPQDVLQPDPLYQDFLCLESGGLAVDLPNGNYRVFVNLDNPSGFWGEYQVYPRRAVLAQGREVAVDTLDFAALKQKYFRFWNVEDLPGDNTFDKYQKTYYHEKTFEVAVTNGQLNLDFHGQNWACSVSAVVVYPVAKAAEGERFLKWVENRRRFHFDNYFKRVLHQPAGEAPRPTENEVRAGYLVFPREPMRALYYNDRPSRREMDQPLRAEAFAGQCQTITVGLLPLQDLGNVTLTAAEAANAPGVRLPAAAFEIGHVSYRLSRVTMDGTVYTISPRLIMPTNTVAISNGITRQFWINIHVPEDAKPGLYHGHLEVRPEHGQRQAIPLELRVHQGTLDPMDIPVGPWGCSIRTPWREGNAEAAAFHEKLATASLRALRQYGFTMFSGIPGIQYLGFKDGRPALDFGDSDPRMQQAKDMGFLAVCNYGRGIGGLDTYFQDTERMKAAGFTDYSVFIKAIFTAIQQHADAHGWLPVYWYLADEPLGDDLIRSTQNAAAYKKAFPKGPPIFTGAGSYAGDDPRDPEFLFAKSFQVADWNLHSEASVRLLREAGVDWGFYNDGSRWTFGDYLYKTVKQFDLKFRLSWHWNAAAGDPYYALDCREDDYAWCNATPDGRLVPAIHFEQLRAGLDDYRHLLTLARLAKAKAGTPAAQAAEALLARRLNSFKLGQRDHDALFGADDWQTARHQAAEAIDALR
jgi:hypothetical protein